MLVLQKLVVNLLQREEGADLWERLDSHLHKEQVLLLGEDVHLVVDEEHRLNVRVVIFAPLFDKHVADAL